MSSLFLKATEKPVAQKWHFRPDLKAQTEPLHSKSHILMHTRRQSPWAMQAVVPQRFYFNSKEMLPVPWRCRAEMPEPAPEPAKVQQYRAIQHLHWDAWLTQAKCRFSICRAEAPCHLCTTLLLFTTEMVSVWGEGNVLSLNPLHAKSRQSFRNIILVSSYSITAKTTLSYSLIQSAYSILAILPKLIFFPLVQDP